MTALDNSSDRMVTRLESVTESVEASPEQARKLFTVDGRRLHSLANVKRWILSELELAALHSLARITDFQSVIPAITYGLGSPWYVAINYLCGSKTSSDDSRQVQWRQGNLFPRHGDRYRLSSSGIVVRCSVRRRWIVFLHVGYDRDLSMRLVSTIGFYLTLLFCCAFLSSR